MMVLGCLLSTYPLDMFASHDLTGEGYAPPDTALVRIQKRGRAATEGGPVTWEWELRDEATRHREAYFFLQSPCNWVAMDEDGWFYRYWHYPTHQCSAGCDEPAFVEVTAVRWLLARDVPAHERDVPGRSL